MQVALNMLLSVAHSTAAMNTELRSRVGTFPRPSAGPQKPGTREKQQHLSQLSMWCAFCFTRLESPPFPIPIHIKSK